MKTERWPEAEGLAPNFFYRVANWATKRVRSRENLRYDRTRVFAAVREIFRALGSHMEKAQAIETARDIFYLETDEAFGWVRGTSSTAQLKPLVELRKSEYAQWQKEAAPADRFWTWGPVWRGNHFAASSAGVQDGEGIQGLAAYPGIVEGRVRCIQDPNTELLQQGEILVCYRTDPGWVPLFPAAAAILVERGSLLSHSAVVARELGIPTIVAILLVNGFKRTVGSSRCGSAVSRYWTNERRRSFYLMAAWIRPVLGRCQHAEEGAGGSAHERVLSICSAGDNLFLLPRQGRRSGLHRSLSASRRWLAQIVGAQELRQSGLLTPGVGYRWPSGIYTISFAKA